jgi:asparagine synthase (glutamine-hydrolysing)
MCGITGIIAFTEKGNSFLGQIEAATNAIARRGPDNAGYFRERHVALGHRRLSIIDVSASANQPMQDESGRFVMVFNGEFFNYREHRKDLELHGETFSTTSDSEVLLRLYMREGPEFLAKINGFFALAIYDRAEQTLFLARDRMGIKPLLYYHDGDKLIFGSEMKALMAAGIPRVLDHLSMLNYFQLNYIPGPWTIFDQVRKLRPGNYVLLDTRETVSRVSETMYYRIPAPPERSGNKTMSYPAACNKLRELLDASVARRLIADVPLGAFLSGGIDSSVIVALAARHTSHLNTFSIGFRDEPMYDETRYAGLVADRYKTNHTVFSLTTDDLFANLTGVLDYLDEPFADSSALAVNILSMHTRNNVTVALSGDGADELFGGYNKHRAEWMLRNRPLLSGTMKSIAPFLRGFRGARNSPFANRLRQIQRFSLGASMDASDRYWRWCGFVDEGEIDTMIDFSYENRDYFRRKRELLRPLGDGKSLNDILFMDMHQVLVNDMLVKVDLMSMAHSLEVRVPFLDYTVVDFAFSIPAEFKIDHTSSKKILRDTFRADLPAELFNRPKHGFEVPLLKWFRTGLRDMIENDLLEDGFVEHQGLFELSSVKRLKHQVFSSHPGEAEARIWGLIVFQYWWKKFMTDNMTNSGRYA